MIQSRSDLIRTAFLIESQKISTTVATSQRQ
jgi:hypothetical protein